MSGEAGLWAEIRRLQERLRHLEGLEYAARAGVADRWRAYLGDALFCCHYDGPAPFETNYTLNTHGHRGQEASRIGGIIGRPGRFGKAVQVAEATTNLVTNPSFETALWNAYGTPTTRQLSTAWSVFGTNSMDLRGDGAGDGASLSLGTLNSGTTYTASIYVKVTRGTAVLSVVRASPPWTGYANTTGIAAGYEGRVHVTFTMPETVACNLIAFVHDGDAFWDGAQVEQKAYPTPYCDGSLGAGHSWSGTAHASTSSRTAAQLYYNMGLGAAERAGALMCWAHVTTTASRTVRRYLLNAHRVWASEALSLQVNEHTPRLNAVFCGWGTGGGWELEVGWHHIAVTWDDRTARLYVDGDLQGHVTISTSPPARWLGTRLGVGLERLTLDRQWGDLIDDVAILDRTMSADEVRAVYESGGPVPVITDPVAFGAVS